MREHAHLAAGFNGRGILRRHGLRQPGSRIRAAAAVAKSAASRFLTSLAGEALQIHGGIGMSWESGIHLLLRRIRVAALLFGSAAYHHEQYAKDFLLACSSARASDQAEKVSCARYPACVPRTCWGNLCLSRTAVESARRSAMPPRTGIMSVRRAS